MATIKVNSATMRDKSGTLTNIAKSIKGFTDEMIAEIDRLRGAWEGEVAETTVTKFKGMAKDFDARISTINSYADFLNKAAGEWDRINNENLQAVQGQKS